jgi:outer membrane receptor protein involved in Fe transport
VIGIALVLTAPIALADQAASSDQLEEVIVTALKRSESEQSVPLSMTTFSSGMLEEKSINTFVDYATKIPNLAFAPTGDGVGTARTVSIRGISGDNVTGFYIDDVPLPDSIDPRVLDVDHIEVLRGPQGTLYGARSMGGTVRIITKQPDLDEVGGTVHVASSKTENAENLNYTGDAVVNLPLIKGVLGLRLSGFYDDQGGFFTRSYCTNPAAVGTTCFPLTGSHTVVKNVGQVNTYGGAASLTWKVNDDLTVTPRLMMQRAGYDGFPMADVDSTPGNGYGYPVPSGPYTLPPLTVNGYNQARLFNVPEGGYDQWSLGSVAIKWKNPFGEIVSSTAYFSRRVFETEDESDFVYAAITSNFGGAPEPGSIAELKDYQRFAQEVRFASAFDGPVQLVAGGFYSDLHGRIPYAAYYPPATVPNLDNTLGGANNPDYANLIFAQDFHTDISEPAAFGEVSYQPVDALKLTAGLRWYHVKITSSGYEEGLAAGGPKIPSPEVETSESGVNPKFEADYHFTADDMVYVNIAKGFRPGGVVPIVPPGQPGTQTDCVAALAKEVPGETLGDTRTYKSDSLWNYELGVKTSSSDRRFTANAAVFYIDWKNIQQQVLLSCGFQYVANAGAASSKGTEFEVRARPLEGLELGLGVGYQDAKITEASAGSPQTVGSPVYQVPNWTANASGSYTVGLASDWSLINGLDFSFIGRSYSGNNDPSDPRLRDSYHLLDGRVALRHDKLEFALVGKNLTNEAADLGDSRSIAAEVPGRPRLFTNQPRTIGLELRQRF